VADPAVVCGSAESAEVFGPTQGDIRPNLRRRKRRLPPLPSESGEQKPELSLTRELSI